jgi:hypothetical protein
MNVELLVDSFLEGETELLKKTCPIAALSTVNLASPDLGSNPLRRGGKTVTNCFSYGTAPRHDNISVKRRPLPSRFFSVHYSLISPTPCCLGTNVRVTPAIRAQNGYFCNKNVATICCGFNEWYFLLVFMTLNVACF